MFDSLRKESNRHFQPTTERIIPNLFEHLPQILFRNLKGFLLRFPDQPDESFTEV